MTGWTASGWAGFAAVGAIALTALTGLSAPSQAAGCLGAEWVDGMPVFGGDCNRSSSRGTQRGASVRKASKQPPDDLRSDDIPFRSYDMLDALEAAIGRYQAVVSAGGWPRLSKGRYLRPGYNDDRIPQLRKRLIISGDLDGRAGVRSRQYDERVVAAVKRFQKRHGLKPNGVIGTRTLAHLNVTAAEKLQQLRVNFRRLSDLMTSTPEPRYVLVNIPAFQLEAVENGRVVQRHRVIVGKRDRQTPTLKATIRGLNFFPYWRVPESIAYRDIIPRLRKEPGYLDKEYIRVIDGFGGPVVDPNTVDWSLPESKRFKFRQDPGEHNALGLVRIDMPNEHIVYMHDTPMKHLFNRYGRSFSAGCVRVQNVTSLARWLASTEPGWEGNKVDEVLSQGIAETLKLKHRLPVYFAYITAWADPSGPVQFRFDLYGRDATAASVMASAGPARGAGPGDDLEYDNFDGPPAPPMLSP